MSEARIHWYMEKELKDPIAVIGFPSIGLVGSIITSFMARELKLDVVAGITFPDIQQYTIIQNGEAYPPIRIYAGSIPKVRKKKKAAPETEEVTETPAEEIVEPKPKKRVKARDIIIATSEISAKPEFVYDFTTYIMQVVREMGAREIIFVDGLPNTDPSARLMGAYSSEGAKKLLEDAGIEPMNEGIIRGMSGVGIYQSKIDGLDTVCLIMPANPQLPDPRAASMMLEPLQKLIPRLDLDTSPLVQEANDIENRVRAQQNQQNMINQNLYG